MLFGEALVTVPCLAHIISPYQIVMIWPLVLRKWQFWRLLSSFLYGGSGIAVVFNTLFL